MNSFFTGACLFLFTGIASYFLTQKNEPQFQEPPLFSHPDLTKTKKDGTKVTGVGISSANVTPTQSNRAGPTSAAAVPFSIKVDASSPIDLASLHEEVLIDIEFGIETLTRQKDVAYFMHLEKVGRIRPFLVELYGTTEVQRCIKENKQIVSDYRADADFVSKRKQVELMRVNKGNMYRLLDEAIAKDEALHPVVSLPAKNSLISPKTFQ
jgi:hypothetical protein